MLSIFNSSVKKLTIDTSWKNKILKITAQKFRMGINFSESSLQTQYFFIVWNKKQMIFLLGKTRLRERKSLNLKKSTNTFTQDTKLYQITYILCKTLSSVSIRPFFTNWLAPKEPFGYCDFGEPIYLFKRYVYTVAYLRIMLQASWDIPEGN